MSLVCVIGLFCSVVLDQWAVPDPYGYVARYANPLVKGDLLLAHNHHDGLYFLKMQEGDVVMYYNDLEWEEYAVTEVLRYQAIPPQSETPLLIDLETGKERTVYWVYDNVFNYGLIFQTCIIKDEDPLWGRIFIRAERKEDAWRRWWTKFLWGEN